MTISSSPQKSDQLPVKKIPVHIKVKHLNEKATKENSIQEDVFFYILYISILIF